MKRIPWLALLVGFGALISAYQLYAGLRDNEAWRAALNSASLLANLWLLLSEIGWTPGARWERMCKQESEFVDQYRKLLDLVMWQRDQMLRTFHAAVDGDFERARSIMSEPEPEEGVRH